MPINNSGFELLENFISQEISAVIIQEIDSELLKCNGGGIRHADKKFRSVSELVSSAYLIEQAEKYLSGEAALVRAIIFDKSPENNWLVAWHQDRTVAVSSRFEEKGWGPWSVKEGVYHVQPPVTVLEEMVTFRLHLDKSDLLNGCLKLIPGSHSQGILSQDKINHLVSAGNELVIAVPALSALVMRPHLLHASSKAIKPSRRRILHLEYSSYKLKSGIEWA